MSPVNLLPVPILIALSCGTIWIVLRFLKIELPKDKFPAIDGLRGVLAFSVFLHHSVVWFYFLKTGDWALPPSYVYSHFGPTSVAFFFMITAFLFFSKLLSASKGGRMDWVRLYRSRFYRIMPLYLVAVLILFIEVAFFSRFRLREHPIDILIELGQWLLFMEADINGINGTKLLVAGVVWSLAFEWLFYCALAPIGRLFFRIPTPIRILAIGLAMCLVFFGIIWYYYPYGIVRRLCPFIGGIAAAFLVKNDKVRKYCSSIWMSAILIFLVTWLFLGYSSIAEPVPFTIACFIFIAIAAGNDVFGILAHPLLRFLGVISYSIYLLHGLLLFAVFRFVIGFRTATSLSPLNHWLVVASCAVVLIVICCFTYRFIEKPGQEYANKA